MDENTTNEVEVVAQVEHKEKKSFTNRDIENGAKAAIKERGFWRIVGFIFVIGFVSAIGGGLPAMLLGKGVQSIIQWIGTFILTIYFLGVIKREKFDMGVIRNSFMRIGSIVGVSLLSGLIVMLPLIIVGVVTSIIFFACGVYPIDTTEPAKLAVFMSIATPFLLIAGIITIILSYRYRLIYFILGEKKLLPVSVIIKRSRLLMEGYRGKGLVMELKYGLAAYAIMVIMVLPFVILLQSSKLILLLLPILIVVAVILFMYVITILGAYWANLYEIRKAEHIEMFEADEELYPNYKMTTIHTVLLTGGVILFGLCIFILRLFTEILPHITKS